MKVVFVAGRFNPLTRGHGTLIETMERIADRSGYQPRIYATRSHDRLRNPLSPEEKLGFIRRAYPGIDSALATNAFDALERLRDEGATAVTLVVGADRASMGKSFARHAESLGLKADLGLVERAKDAVSATAARLAIQNGDRETWRSLAPVTDETWIEEVFRAVRREMGEECH